MAGRKANESGLEKSFEQLNEIMRRLGEDGVSLEESFELYKKGMDILKVCDGQIDKVEKELIIIEENGN